MAAPAPHSSWGSHSQRRRYGQSYPGTPPPQTVGFQPVSKWGKNDYRNHCTVEDPNIPGKTTIYALALVVDSGTAEQL